MSITLSTLHTLLLILLVHLTSITRDTVHLLHNIKLVVAAPDQYIVSVSGRPEVPSLHDAASVIEL